MLLLELWLLIYLVWVVVAIVFAFTCDCTVVVYLFAGLFGLFAFCVCLFVSFCWFAQCVCGCFYCWYANLLDFHYCLVCFVDCGGWWLFLFVFTDLGCVLLFDYYDRLVIVVGCLVGLFCLLLG